MAFVPAICTQCGAPIEVDDTKEAGICPHCGTAFVTEKVINVNNIKIENAQINVEGLNMNNLLIRAKEFEQSGDRERAIEYYDKVLDIDAANAEAKEGIARCSHKKICGTEFDADQLKEIASLINSGQKVMAIKRIREMTGLGLKEAKDIADAYEAEINPGKASAPKPQQSIPAEQKSTSKGGCYIATCVYGSYDCPEVWTLRRFRDNTLDLTYTGRLFIQIYYRISPTIVKQFGQTTWFKRFWKMLLDGFVMKLNRDGIESTQYSDKY